MNSTDFFQESEPIVNATSPGRLDVMGGIADYSGSLLLQMPIVQTTTVSIQKRSDNIIRIRSLGARARVREFIMDKSEFGQKTVAEAGQVVRSKTGGDWASYIVGCIVILEEKQILKSAGANILVDTHIPEGKGVSSSAALEIATMHALAKAYGLKIDPLELAVMAQRVENSFVGAACGLMDQLSAQFGEKNKLLPLICQPHFVMEGINIPKGISFSGIDSGVRHAVSGASYADVRTSAFMAYSIIASHEGISVKDLQIARDSGIWNDLPYNGFLANIPVSVFEDKYAGLIPGEILGTEFISQYSTIIDKATEVFPQKKYKLLPSARHPIYENFRLNGFKQLLEMFQKSKHREQNLQLMGEMMFQSHASYGAVGLGNEKTDEIVQGVRDAGFTAGLYGARISGGGSGGTVVILSYGKLGKQSTKEIHKTFSAKWKQKLFFFAGSNHGALTLNR